MKDLQNQLNREGVDAAWCVEKGDLVAVQRFVAGICEAKDCRKRASMSCTRNLECGHHCGGVRGERLCLPCLEVIYSFKSGLSVNQLVCMWMRGKS